MENTAASNTEVLCPACAQPGRGKHCEDCGEIMHPRRITLVRMFQSVPDVFFDVEHGLFYTIKCLIKKPGETIREYLKGDRLRHYKPLKFILFIGGLYAFLFVAFNIHQEYKGMDTPVLVADGITTTSRNIEQFIQQWTSVIMLLQFPLVALGSWIIFHKRKYFYGEHLTANAFIIGEVMLYYIVLFPVYLLANGTKWVLTLNQFYQLWILVYYIYAYYDLFYSRKTIKGFLISLGFVIIMFLVVLWVTLQLTAIIFILKMKLFGS